MKKLTLTEQFLFICIAIIVIVIIYKSFLAEEGLIWKTD
mgnify:CR=1 FL=1